MTIAFSGTSTERVSANSSSAVGRNTTASASGSRWRVESLASISSAAGPPTSNDGVEGADVAHELLRAVAVVAAQRVDRVARDRRRQRVDRQDLVHVAQLDHALRQRVRRRALGEHGDRLDGARAEVALEQLLDAPLLRRLAGSDVASALATSIPKAGTLSAIRPAATVTATAAGRRCANAASRASRPKAGDPDPRARDAPVADGDERRDEREADHRGRADREHAAERHRRQHRVGEHVQADERDADGQAGDEHRAPRGGDRAGEQLLDRRVRLRHALLAEAGDDEQAVVHRETEAEQRDHVHRELADRHGAGQRVERRAARPRSSPARRPAGAARRRARPGRRSARPSGRRARSSRRAPRRRWPARRTCARPAACRRRGPRARGSPAAARPPGRPRPARRRLRAPGRARRPPASSSRRRPAARRPCTRRGPPSPRGARAART